MKCKTPVGRSGSYVVCRRDQWGCQRCDYLLEDGADDNPGLRDGAGVCCMKCAVPTMCAKCETFECYACSTWEKEDGDTGLDFSTEFTLTKCTACGKRACEQCNKNCTACGKSWCGACAHAPTTWYECSSQCFDNACDEPACAAPLTHVCCVCWKPGMKCPFCKEVPEWSELVTDGIPPCTAWSNFTQ